MPKIIGTPKPRFNLVDKQQKETYLVLLFRYKCNGRPYSMKYSPGEKVETKYWDSKAGSVKFNRKYQDEYPALNARLNALQALTIQIWKETGGCIQPEDFKKELDYRRGIKERPEGNEPKTPSLLEFLTQSSEEQTKEYIDMDHLDAAADMAREMKRINRERERRENGNHLRKIN